MPCGCGGSKQLQQQRRDAALVPANKPREGGPGQPGYTWDGPPGFNKEWNGPTEVSKPAKSE